MTLNGTNSYIIGAGSGAAVVVDPGPDDQGHLDALVAAAGPIALVLYTHWHSDHTGAFERFSEMTNAPSRAAKTQYTRGAGPLVDGEVIELGGIRIRVLATPGHSSDSISVVLPAYGEHGAILTGDTILGGSTTMIDHPDGSLADYFETLDKIEALGDARIFPAHGDPIESAATEARRLRAHRQERLQQIQHILATHAQETGEDASVDDILAAVYADAPEFVVKAARLSIEAQLSFLQRAQG
ncbi:MAG: MBL fold metallo-hydrolase [Gulosibacter sp.]|uniref:MBL fold metallo-hydrolase n=1 Tax=Gulosibacter sp. TaxID=2817531 RepID=UPI003F930CA2